MTFSSAGCRRVAQIRIDLFSNRISCLQDVFLRAGNNLRLSLEAISELYVWWSITSKPNCAISDFVWWDMSRGRALSWWRHTPPVSHPFLLFVLDCATKILESFAIPIGVNYYIWEAGNSRATRRSTPTCATRRQPGMTTVYKSSWCGWGRSSGGEVTLDSKRAFSSSFLTMCKIL